MGYCERPFARVSPPSGGRRAAPLRRKPGLFARSPCVRLSCVPALVGVSPALLHAGRPCQGTRVLLRSHILLAHALWRGRSLCSLGGVPCWGLLWACLLAGGWVSCLRAGRVRLLVFACFGVGVLAWGGGTVWSRRPCPACLVGAHASGVGLLACARLVCARWAEGGQVGAGQRCPAPIAWRWAARRLRARGERRCVWGAPRGVLTRAHAQREEGGGGGGEPRGADRGGLAGGCGWCWHTMLASSAHPGESKIGTTGAGAGCAPGRGGVLVVGARGGCGFWWWRSFLWVRGVVLGGVALSPWWWVGLVVTISPW